MEFHGDMHLSVSHNKTKTAVAGYPKEQPDHAVVMARFANDCSKRMQKLCKELERTLGPETSELGCRFGLHSGPVTAGVLRGHRGRFQLFGATVDVAGRMEATGVSELIVFFLHDDSVISSNQIGRSRTRFRQLAIQPTSSPRKDMGNGLSAERREFL